MWIFVFLVAFLLGGKKARISIGVLVFFWAIFLKWQNEIFLTEGTVVVTGSSSGIGRNATFYLAEKGIHVIGTFRKESDLDSLMNEAIARNVTSRMHFVKCDVRNEKDVLYLVNETCRLTQVEKKFPKLIGEFLLCENVSLKKP